MVKISKLQLEVISKLAEGCILRTLAHADFYIVSENGEYYMDLTSATFQALLNKGLIIKIKEVKEGFVSLYDYCLSKRGQEVVNHVKRHT